MTALALGRTAGWVTVQAASSACEGARRDAEAAKAQLATLKESLQAAQAAVDRLQASRSGLAVLSSLCCYDPTFVKISFFTRPILCPLS